MSGVSVLDAGCLMLDTWCLMPARWIVWARWDSINIIGRCGFGVVEVLMWYGREVVGVEWTD